MKSLEHVNIDSENPLYLIVNNVDGYIECNSIECNFIEEKNGDKYLIFASRDKNKEVLEKYTELWDEIKNQIETIYSGESIEYKKDFIKIRFESDDNLPLGNILSVLGMIIVVRFVFQENNRNYPYFYLRECLYESVNEL